MLIFVVKSVFPGEAPDEAFKTFKSFVRILYRTRPVRKITEIIFLYLSFNLEIIDLLQLFIFKCLKLIFIKYQFLIDEVSYTI